MMKMEYILPQHQRASDAGEEGDLEEALRATATVLETAEICNQHGIPMESLDIQLANIRGLEHGILRDKLDQYLRSTDWAYLIEDAEGEMKLRIYLPGADENAASIIYGRIAKIISEIAESNGSISLNMEARRYDNQGHAIDTSWLSQKRHPAVKRLSGDYSGQQALTSRTSRISHYLK